jgi:hypothetical protein
MVVQVVSDVLCEGGRFATFAEDRDEEFADEALEGRGRSGPSRVRSTIGLDSIVVGFVSQGNWNGPFANFHECELSFDERSWRLVRLVLRNWASLLDHQAFDG